jgi:hypothetical protein
MGGAVEIYDIKDLGLLTIFSSRELLSHSLSNLSLPFRPAYSTIVPQITTRRPYGLFLS